VFLGLEEEKAVSSDHGFEQYCHCSCSDHGLRQGDTDLTDVPKK